MRNRATVARQSMRFGGSYMQKKDLAFLTELVEAPSPSGFEQPAAKVFRDRLTRTADSIDTNVMGSVHALLKGKDDGVSVMLAGHIDEIGLMVNYICLLYTSDAAD